MDQVAVPPQRNKKPVRVFYFLLLLVFVVLLLDGVISLGAFGVVQARVHSFQPDLDVDNTQCILFGSYVETVGEYIIINLSNIGSCAFVLWGQVTVVVIAFAWILFNLLQIIVAPRIVSVLRILDVLVMGLSFLLSFALSITITAGLSRTCAAFNSIACSLTSLISQKDYTSRLYYYNGVYSAQSSSWVATCMFFALTVFNIIMVIAFCKRSRKREVHMMRFKNEDSPDPAVDELENVAEEKKLEDPFVQT